MERIDLVNPNKLTAAFLDLDSPYLAGPFVNILKKMVVNRLEMIKVEIPRGNRFQKALRYKLALRCLQCREIPEIQLVSKNREIGRIAIVRVAHSTAARPLRFLSRRAM